jgi:hypothetical protein
MRWLIGLAVTAALLVAGDTAVRAYAESTIAGRLERDLGADGAVAVSLGGFPFVAGLLTEDIPNATVVAEDIESDGLQIDRLTVEAEGVHISLIGADARTGAAEVDSGDGVAIVRLRVLAEFLRTAGDIASLRIDDRGVTVWIPSLDRAITAPLRLERGRIVIRTPAFDDIVVPLPRAFGDIRYGSIEVAGDRARLTFRLNTVALRSL